MELKYPLNVSGWLCPQIRERNKHKSSVGGTYYMLNTGLRYFPQIKVPRTKTYYDRYTQQKLNI